MTSDLKPNANKRIAKHFQLKTTASSSLGENSLSVRTFVEAALLTKKKEYADLRRQDDYLLFSFDSVQSIEAFRDAVQVDRERYRTFFIENAHRIAFGGRLLEKRPCKSRKHTFFRTYQTLSAYRDLLERDNFLWPNLRFCGNEWRYDYGAEIPVRGLDLPEEILEQIYRDKFYGKKSG